MIWAELPDVVIRLAVAGLGGLAVGIEREWSRGARGGTPRFAGVRTFLLLGLIGGMAAELHARGLPLAGAGLLAGAAALVVGAYILTARRGDVDGTTEVSALVVLAAGVLAGSGRLALASGLFALTALVLVEKSRIHSLVHRMESQTLEAAARFAVLALVVLPLLPQGPFGPMPGIRPRELWSLVLLFPGLSFAGFLALQALGSGAGYGLAGLLGGLTSSTAVTLNFSRESRAQTEMGPALGLGVIAASTILLVRVWLLATLLNGSVGLRVLSYFWIPFVTGVVAAALALRRQSLMPAHPEMPQNPLRLSAAVQMALAFQAVLYLMQWISGRFGSPGIMLSAAILGLTDMDALTYSMTTLGSSAADVLTVAQALAVGILANTLLKLALAVAIGRGAFRRTAGPGLATLAAGSAVALFLYWVPIVRRQGRVTVRCIVGVRRSRAYQRVPSLQER